MDGAIYALIVNACVALLFAVSFAIIRLSYPGQNLVGWFCAAYLIGMVAPLSELALLLPVWDVPFIAVAYVCLLLSVLTMALGLAALARQPLPWREAGVILLVGLVARAAIWGGQRGSLGYEMVYQTAFVGASALSTMIAVGAARRGGGRLWAGVAAVFGVITVYFLLKPFMANWFGVGVAARDYTTSPYALFSQATGGILLTTAGLLVLLTVISTTMGRTIRESETDPLTVIANRRGFERRAAPMIAAARLTGSPLAVAIFDLDHFKRINDRYGHAAGDAVICAFANLLRTMVFPLATPPSGRSATLSDSSAAWLPARAIARLGGEEFVVLFEHMTLAGAWVAAQAIRAAVAGLGPQLPAITISGGIASLEPGDTLETLLDRADKWTYAAKAGGRNRICPNPGRTGPALKIVA